MSRQLVVGLLCGFLWVGSSLAHAEGQAPRAVAEETREFEILVKEKPVGTTRIRISDLEDGTTVAATNVDVAMSFVVYTYRYEFRGRETWQQDRLLSIENRATDAGKVLATRAQVDADGSTIEVKDQPARKGPALRMSTNYWRLPPPAQGKFSIIESDNGKIHVVELQRLGADEVVVENQKVQCTHYRVAGDTAADLWFDARHRLVRQRTVEQGHPTELRLTRLVYNTTTTARR